MADIGETDLWRWNLCLRLEDGTSVTIEPIRPGVSAELIAFHEGLSPETVYRRFFGAHPHLSAAEAERFTNVDFQNRFALVARSGGKLIAVARFDRLPDTVTAEVAFVVADEYQRHGVGRVLLTLLAVAARERGIRRFAADTLFSNAAMRRVFAAAGFRLCETVEGGVVHVEFPIVADL